MLDDKTRSMYKIIQAKTMHKSLKIHLYQLSRLERLFRGSYSNKTPQRVVQDKADCRGILVHCFSFHYIYIAYYEKLIAEILRQSFLRL